MSSSRKRSDLIERIRYPNPLPLPPYPPKLLHIPTPADRYADPSWSSRLANSVPLPLVVDSEGGIPLDLNRFPELWDPQLQQRAQAAAPPSSELHSEDAWLLNPSLADSSAPPPILATPAHLQKGLNADRAPNSANGTGGASTPLHGGITAKDVGWLRRTEYLGADRKAKAEAAVRAKPALASAKDTSPDGEIKRIEATFTAIQEDSIAGLRHPTKKDITPVESYDLYPDFDTWSTEMHVFKFSDPPGRQGVAHDARLALSLLRPRKDPYTSRPMMSFYLPSTSAPETTAKELDEILLADEDAFDAEDREFFQDQAGQLDDSTREAAIVRREEQRRKRGWVGELPTEPEEDDIEDDAGVSVARLEYIAQRAQATTPYKHQRDYDVEMQGGQEEWQRVLVLNFGSGDDTSPLVEAERQYASSSSSSSSSSAKRIAHYHPIIQRTTLRVKRHHHGGIAAGGEDADGDDVHWPNIALTHENPSQREMKKRVRARGQVEKVRLGDLEEVESEEEEEEQEGDEAEEEEAVEDNNDDDDDEKAEDGRKPSDAAAQAAVESDADVDRDGDDDDAGSAGSGSDEEDADLDDDELAGLREEADGGGSGAGGGDGENATGGGRGSRRAAAVAAATATEAENANGSGAMDVDDDEE